LQHKIAQRVTNAQILEALMKSAGIISAAAEQLPICRQAVQNRLRRSPGLRKQADKITEVNLDFAESKLLENIKEGNVASIIFYLKTKGKDRGYVERTETKSEHTERRELSVSITEGVQALSEVMAAVIAGDPDSNGAQPGTNGSVLPPALPAQSG
jgi:hypothetical protein